MADAEQLARLRGGVEEWNAWRKKNRGLRVDLLKSDLHESNLSGANLSKTDLRDGHPRTASGCWRTGETSDNEMIACAPFRDYALTIRIS